ncbi:MAG: AAA family ATPase, partial [Actinobacteria bacterium]|nr:AAA family ATPase [Actinomycetota bacterium]
MSQWTISRRPQTLDQMYGLENIKRYFYERAKTEDWPKAVLLRGQFGNGKTTTAKILAAMMVAQEKDRKGNPLWTCPSTKAILEERYDRDVMLIDGGQSSKSEVIDQIREFIATPPMFDKRKVIIIEEVQELSTAARNSLLKTLEHPREKIHF